MPDEDQLKARDGRDVGKGKLAIRAAELPADLQLPRGVPEPPSQSVTR
jgi:hypothetical protein